MHRGPGTKDPGTLALEVLNALKDIGPLQGVHLRAFKTSGREYEDYEAEVSRTADAALICKRAYAELFI